MFDKVWADPALSPRDRSLLTVAALVVLGRRNELAAHLWRAIDNGISKAELSAAITHLAFYAGFPAAIDASSLATDTLGPLSDPPAGPGEKRSATLRREPPTAEGPTFQSNWRLPQNSCTPVAQPD